MKHLAAVAAVALLATGAFAQTTPHDHSAMMQSQAAMNHDDMFADAMTMHHQDGIRMAEMAVEKAATAELRSMAQKMIDDQKRDIEAMQSRRGNTPKMAMQEMMAMPGMMPESEMQRDMARLRETTGAGFDAAFAEVMAKHHQGAVSMSNHEIEKGTNEGMKAIAREIADRQTRERRQLLAMHESLTDDQPMTSAASERQRMTKD